MSATPTPWRAQRTRARRYPSSSILDANGDYVIEARMGRPSPDQAEAIVRAVNIHAALVAALERLASVEGLATAGTFHGTQGEELVARIDFARAALALVKKP